MIMHEQEKMGKECGWTPTKRDIHNVEREKQMSTQNEDKNHITKETELLNRKVHGKYNKGLDGLHPDYHDVFAPDEEEV